MIQLQKIDFPTDCEIITHEFYDYDPVASFRIEDSMRYLSEDLIECSFPDEHLVVDLGWYGDVVSNKGEFKIQIVQDANWEMPVNVLYSKSVQETRMLLDKILTFYTGSIEEDEDNEF